MKRILKKIAGAALVSILMLSMNSCLGSFPLLGDYPPPPPHERYDRRPPRPLPPPPPEPHHPGPRR